MMIIYYSLFCERDANVSVTYHVILALVCAHLSHVQTFCSRIDTEVIFIDTAKAIDKVSQNDLI